MLAVSPQPSHLADPQAGTETKAKTGFPDSEGDRRNSWRRMKGQSFRGTSYVGKGEAGMPREGETGSGSGTSGLIP